ncbi:ComEA family DNA-binding protein [Fervidobacterium thailandense]|uniref:Helix-hairpin-helix DNA-binding motif class 1 domain-containing protein n=1 Tax=Fervidobacterium thailandense TaxID=1008305 RepID=A0A1E3G4D9_9BACT|nr:ComEA family DNA-binding protein [Fervidobacterium thailandense]ODN31104.1 hypothetical protein A4H02_02220 [Fervidobacterium thailandense]
MASVQEPQRNEKFFLAIFAVLIVIFGIVFQPRLRNNLGWGSMKREETENKQEKSIERKYADSVLDINLATQEELETLPGIGPSKAKAIVEYRKLQPFKRPEDLMNVPGIGPKTYEKLKNRIKVSGVSVEQTNQGGQVVTETTTTKKEEMTSYNQNNTTNYGSQLLNINTATVSELEKLPGIGPTKAAEIIRYRTENGPFKSVDELLNVKGIGPKTLEKIRPLVCAK